MSPWKRREGNKESERDVERWSCYSLRSVPTALDFARSSQPARYVRGASAKATLVPLQQSICRTKDGLITVSERNIVGELVGRPEGSIIAVVLRSNQTPPHNKPVLSCPLEFSNPSNIQQFWSQFCAGLLCCSVCSPEGST